MARVRCHELCRRASPITTMKLGLITVIEDKMYMVATQEQYDLDHPLGLIGGGVEDEDEACIFKCLNREFYEEAGGSLDLSPESLEEGKVTIRGRVVRLVNLPFKKVVLLYRPDLDINYYNALIYDRRFAMREELMEVSRLHLVDVDTYLTYEGEHFNFSKLTESILALLRQTDMYIGLS